MYSLCVGCVNAAVYVRSEYWELVFVCHLVGSLGQTQVIRLCEMHGLPRIIFLTTIFKFFIVFF